MPKLSYYRNKADKAMQEHYRAKNLACEYCGKPAQTMHHFFPKSRASALRYHEPNLIPICNGCHFAHHNGDPRIHAKIIEKRGMKWYKDLLKKKEEITKANQGYYKSIIELYDSN